MPANSGTPYHKKPYTVLVEDMLGILKTGQGGHTALTDATEGSVVRTLVEVFAHELAVAYEQLDRVYRFGFLDTAEGPALDNVVALVGIERRRAGYLEGEVTFQCPQPAPADISIPAGTPVAGRDTPLFETVEAAVLRQGDTGVRVTVRSVEPATDPVAAGSLSLMPRPIAGVDSLTNRNEILPRQRAETDPELRERARSVMQGGRRGTVAALQEAAASLGIRSIAVNETRDGRVTMTLGDEDLDEATVERARARVEAVRPAGVPVRVQAAKRIRTELIATLVLDSDRYRDEEKAAIRNRVQAELMGYFQRLELGERIRWTKIRNLLTGPDEVVDVEPTGQRPFMDPQEQSEKGEWISVASTRTMGDDIALEPNDRAFLEPQYINLSLEPPWVEARLDLNLTLKAGTDSTGIETRTRGVLRNLFPKLTGKPLGAETVLRELPDRGVITTLELTVARERDGSVTVLDGSEGEEPVPLGKRELVKLGNLTVSGGSDG